MTLYAIGDIQGCLEPFERLLAAISFTPGTDRLWLVGDLVNRGPDSLGVLRRVIALGDSVSCVLGNHDLHLLAAAAGVRGPRAGDTFQDVLAAAARNDLVDWLRRQPLLHYDAEAQRVLVHAGVPPLWSTAQALDRAAEIETLLRGEHWTRALAGMYGDEPSTWSDALAGAARVRFTINALTRMRYCDAHGRLDFAHNGPPGTQPDELVPWFDVPGRRACDTHIVFGHWAALGVLRRTGLTALDSGCVWGGSLSAAPLEPPGEVISVRC